MSDSLLNALKVFVIVGAVVLVGGTATLIWALVKRGASRAAPPEAAGPPPPPGTILVPAGAEIAQATLTGSRLLLLGQAPGEGQFVLLVDAASGARRSFLRLVPEGR
jgi:hypothetical protein